jgi:hypothetical protein
MLKTSAQRRSPGWTDGDSRGAPSGALPWKRHLRVALWLECSVDAHARVLTSWASPILLQTLRFLARARGMQ